MEIKINITAPPDGYSIPEWRPIYLPFGDAKILIGECWVYASDELKYGGGWHIWCHALEAGRAKPCRFKFNTCRLGPDYPCKVCAAYSPATQPAVQPKTCTCGVGQADKYCGKCGGLL